MINTYFSKCHWLIPFSFSTRSTLNFKNWQNASLTIFQDEIFNDFCQEMTTIIVSTKKQNKTKIKPIKKSLTKNFHPNLSHQNQGPFCTSSSKKELKLKHIVTLNSKLSQKAIHLFKKS